MLMKVSHESPISILEESKAYNDFDYALVHLFETHPQYKAYFKSAVDVYNREVLLDNSIFELGKAFDSEKYIKEILWLKPNMFIVPDVLEESRDTINSYKLWRSDGKLDHIKNTFQTKTIGAIQGKTWQELISCYKFMSENADMIAISFDFSYYHITGEGWNPLERFCSGRQRFISQLIERGVWAWNKPHHLLGCSLAKEFRYYVDNNIYNIVSCDTSNPIVAAIHNMKYDVDYGLQNKPTTKLADLIDYNFTQEQLELVIYNTTMFKKIIRR
jgi:hypothetical protein